jgi:hypothetical protein
MTTPNARLVDIQAEIEQASAIAARAHLTISAATGERGPYAWATCQLERAHGRLADAEAQISELRTEEAALSDG